MTLRPLLFWLHLIAGVVAGLVIAVMSFTGSVLAFEKEIVAWVERDVRKVTIPSPASPLPLDDLIAKIQLAQPGFRPSSLTVFADPGAAVLMSLGRTNAWYVNPYTGETQPQAAGVRRLMQLMMDWHRWLGRGTESRAAGKAITGACNVAFFVLAVTGLYLWWPSALTFRAWSRTKPASAPQAPDSGATLPTDRTAMRAGAEVLGSLRARAILNLRARGKARDWNWHNVIGFWSAPILIVLTLTAMPISYRWAGDLIYRMTGTKAPAQDPAPGGRSSTVTAPKPPEGSKPLTKAALLQIAQEQVPHWQQVTLRLAGPGSRGGAGRKDEKEISHREQAAGGERRNAQPVSLSIKEQGSWPNFATIQLTLDPMSGSVLKKETFADFNRGRQVRSWTRFLHTGEALGWAGQAVAGLASLGTVVLVYTGFALAWRRLAQWKRSRVARA